jgi:hypothetical protein
MLSKKDGKLIPKGGKKQRFGGAVRAIDQDDLVNLDQLTNFIGDNLVTSPGAFTTPDTNRAIKVKLGNSFVYLQVLDYP